MGASRSLFQYLEIMWLSKKVIVPNYCNRRLSFDEPFEIAINVSGDLLLCKSDFVCLSSGFVSMDGKAAADNVFTKRQKIKGFFLSLQEFFFLPNMDETVKVWCLWLNTLEEYGDINRSLFIWKMINILCWSCKWNN